MAEERRTENFQGEYHYAKSLSCGHFVEVVCFMLISPESRIGQLDLCNICRYKLGKIVGESMHEVTDFRLMEPHEWQA